MLRKKQILMDLQQLNLAQDKKKMKMRNFMNLKFQKNLMECIRMIQNSNKCLENFQIVILQRKNVQSFKLIKKAEVYKVQLISLMMRKIPKKKVNRLNNKTTTLKLKEFKEVILHNNIKIDKATLQKTMTKRKQILIQRIQKTSKSSNQNSKSSMIKTKNSEIISEKKLSN